MATIHPVKLIVKHPLRVRGKEKNSQQHKMKPWLTAVLLATLMQLSQTHPLTLFRITRSNVPAEDDSQILLANIEQDPSSLIEVPRSLVDPQVILINVAYPGGEDGDLSVSETQIFRPLFTYRQQVAKRLRLKKVVDQK